MTSATAGLMIVGLFPQSDEADTRDGREGQVTAAQLADKLLPDEHADVLRASVAWMARELIEAESAPRSVRSSVAVGVSH